MKTNVSYEEALRRASDPLRAKIERSVEIVRKAEKLAMLYSDKGFYLAFSGGKDSQALYHIAELAGVPFVAEYSVTTCDPPKLIAFIKRNYPEVGFTRPKESIYSRALSKHHGLLPTRLVRWCCADFKEGSGGNRVTLTGVRKEESPKRATRKAYEVVSGEKSHRFQGDSMEDVEAFRRERFENRKPSDTDDFMKFRCIKGKDDFVLSPILDWSETEVWEFLNDVMQVPHCVLYDEGEKRLGCILCPLSKKSNKMKDAVRYPHHKHKWIGVILQMFERVPENVNRFLPEGIDEFNSKFQKETVESFGGKYSKREIEAAEAVFDYWLQGDGYDKWFHDTYYVELPEIKTDNSKIKINIRLF